jgi:hypothetical protein
VGRLVLLLGVVFAVSACGSHSTETVTVQSPAETVTVEATPTVTPASLSTPTFQMPSKNIGCATSEGVLVCDILSGLEPEPKQKCELDWTGMEMERLGPSQPRCAGDTAYDQSAPVLEYGAAWNRDGFTCVSQKDGLQCRNKENHGFTLSRETWKGF